MKPEAFGILLLACGVALTACGAPSASPPEPGSPGAASADAGVDSARGAAAVQATRDDVSEAMTCHALVSQALADQILGGDGGAVAGIDEQRRWRAELDRRVQSAGLTGEDLNALQAQTRVPITSPAEWEAKLPMVEACVARTPAG